MMWGFILSSRFTNHKKDSGKAHVAVGALSFLRRPCEALNTYLVQGTIEMCLTPALPSVSVSVESGCWTEGQGAGPVKY